MNTSVQITSNSHSSQGELRRGWPSAVRLLRSLIGAAVLLLAVTQQASASDPIGIYAVIDKVVIEPSESAPERVQIWGVFSLAEGGGNQYRAPEAGYLYFRFPEKKAELAKREWKDLLRMVGKSEAVGFGARYLEKGTVRSAKEKPSKPDVYPIGFGLSRITEARNYPVIERLLEAARKHREKRNES